MRWYVEFRTAGDDQWIQLGGEYRHETLAIMAVIDLVGFIHRNDNGEYRVVSEVISK